MSPFTKSIVSVGVVPTAVSSSTATSWLATTVLKEPPLPGPPQQRPVAEMAGHARCRSQVRAAPYRSGKRW